MSNCPPIPFETTLHVRDHCLCLHAQRAARALGRRFDDALRGCGLTNGQFSLLMSLNRPQPPALGAVASLLAMDRTTLTAALKPLQTRGLVRVMVDERDRRSRRLALTPQGMAKLFEALPIWTATHDEVDRALGETAGAAVRPILAALGAPSLPVEAPSGASCAPAPAPPGAPCAPSSPPSQQGNTP